MNILKIIISYLLGIALVHLLLAYSIFQLIPMILGMGFHLDETMSSLIHIYVVGGLATYLFYYLLTRKKITKLFKYCWLTIGGLIVAFYTYKIHKVIYNFMYDHFMTSVHDYYYNVYYFQDAFSLILVYILCQLSAILLYFIVKLCLWLWNRVLAK